MQHKNIPEAQLHEPKGISTALAKKAYISNGAGSGSWEDIDSTMLQGLAGDAGIANKKFLTNGTNGFSLVTDTSYGSATITNNATNFPLTAVADTTFNTTSQFTLLTGVGAPWASENLSGITFDTNKLTVSVTGIYMIDFWCNIASFTGNNARVAFRHRVNGTTYSTRKPTARGDAAADQENISAFGLVQLTANDYIQLVVASDATGNLLLSDVNVTLTLIRQTA